ncbi:MAG: winged helix-turn-helix transcriptional regulator [Cyanobacteriota bacterium]|nr:helix-turn-helix transcriptional regulator [Cyanobium sp. 49614_E6]
MGHISAQWTIYILWILSSHGELHFGELKRKVNGISTKVLADRLRLLESIQLVCRQVEEGAVPRVAYRLTERGKQLSEVLDSLYEYAVEWYGNESPSPL